MKTNAIKKIVFCGIILTQALALQAAPQPPNGQGGQSGNAPPITFGSAINKAGRSDMLTQRMGKAYAMTALDVESRLAATLMSQSQQAFDSQLADLKSFTPTPEIKEAVFMLEQAWVAYKTYLNLPPTAKNGVRVYKSGDVTLELAHRVTRLYEQASKTVQGHLVNVAARQRMLAQRIARAYFFDQWAVQIQGDNPVESERLRSEAKQALESARTEFATAAKELNQAPQNNETIKRELQLADQQWLFFQRALNGTEKNKKTEQKNVATTSERILEQEDEVAKQYELIAR